MIRPCYQSARPPSNSRPSVSGERKVPEDVILSERRISVANTQLLVCQRDPSLRQDDRSLNLSREYHFGVLLPSVCHACEGRSGEGILHAVVALISGPAAPRNQFLHGRIHGLSPGKFLRDQAGDLRKIRPEGRCGRGSPRYDGCAKRGVRCPKHLGNERNFPGPAMFHRRAAPPHARA